MRQVYIFIVLMMYNSDFVFRFHVKADDIFRYSVYADVAFQQAYNAVWKKLRLEKRIPKKIQLDFLISVGQFHFSSLSRLH